MGWKGYKISQGWVLHFHSEFGPTIPLSAPTHCPWKYRIWRARHSFTQAQVTGLIPLRETFYWKITFGHCERAIYQKNRRWFCVLVWRWFWKKNLLHVLVQIYSCWARWSGDEFTIKKTQVWHHNILQLKFYSTLNNLKSSIHFHCWIGVTKIKMVTLMYD